MSISEPSAGIRYRLSIEDFAALQTHFQTSSGLLKKVGRRLAVLLAILPAAIALVVVNRYDHINIAGLLLLMAALFCVGFFIEPLFRLPFLQQARRRRSEQLAQFLLAHGKNRSFFAEHEMRIDAEGITTRTPVTATSISWQAVERIEETAEHIFIACGSNAYVTIPRRAFASPESSAEFLTAARRLMEQAA